jgi:hypothetical protein
MQYLTRSRTTTMKIFHYCLAITLALICFAARIVMADADEWEKMKHIKPQGYVCYQATTPLKIDGRLDDDAWSSAPWTVDFADIQGSNKPEPRFRTRAKMLWDADCLYIAAELDEPHVWGTLIKHDSVIFHDNDFEVFIDPDGDNHEYYEFEMNALNTGWDLFLPRPYSDGGSADDGWEIPGLKTAVHSERSVQHRQGLVAGDRDSLASARPTRTPRRPAKEWRSVANELFPSGMGTRNQRWKISEGRRKTGRQLGLVAAGNHQHAPARALGICAVLRRETGHCRISTRSDGTRP